MVAPQQTYQAASFSASSCVIKNDLPALVACLVRAGRRKAAVLIPFLRASSCICKALKQGLAPLQKAPGGAATQVPHVLGTPTS